MLPGLTDTLFVSGLEIEVHHLLDYGFTLCGYAFIEKHLILNFRNRRAFNGGGVRDDGIQIELLVINLRVYCQFLILGKKGYQFVNLGHNHQYCAAKIIFSPCFLLFLPTFSPYLFRWMLCFTGPEGLETIGGLEGG